ncbi:uncharacterized protein LOC126894531 [Daktulosphaira vitifoliae]|uniref:uncharacterized protein LOC126894531 n=1 Tax=Daktulosphaira vitifoliae TaxID=58002 RepID=UPI0021AA9DB5|nr:uncharacterized protein LOC126894531 [Daktulosphaira vitifoliae]
MIFFMKRIVILSILYTIEPIISHSGIFFPKNIEEQNWNSSYSTFSVRPYYNKVDLNWKINKCKKLGFTRKNSMVGQQITSNMIPVDVYFNKSGLYELLAEFLCQDITISSIIQNNVFKNMKENNNIKIFFNSEERYNEYIEEFIDVQDTNIERPSLDTELLAISDYLDVCIYLFKNLKNVWFVFRGKDWPDYRGVDMKYEDCIYLYENNDGTFGVVSNVTGPYL